MSITGFTLSVTAAAGILLAVACGVEGQAAPPTTSSSEDHAASVPTPTPQSTPTPELPTVLSATSTPAPPAATVTTEGCYDRGYAGRIRDPNDKNIDIYLLVEPPDDPVDDARAIAETLCVLGGKYTPPGEVRVMKANYTLKQLEGWYALLRDQIWQIDGLWYSDMDEGDNRLSYGVLSELGKSRVLALAQEHGIPADAIYAEIPPQIELNNPPAIPTDSGMKISVEYPPELISGQPAKFSVIVTNSNEQEKEIMYNSASPADIVILDSNGSELWRYMTGVTRMPGGQSLLLPGESITFPVSWSGLSHDGIAVPPGQYLVRGFVKFRFEGASGSAGHDLSTAPEEIVLVGQ
ncbi:MAG: BsuPI-related putative proteinase inhibitor [Chloroflexi bacterium]|nr:BsuPI-related putative proteinase inhibitor [Chloroflexota bacterium]